MPPVQLEADSSSALDAPMPPRVKRSFRPAGTSVGGCSAGLIRRGSYKPEPGWGRFALQVLAGSLVLAALLAWASGHFDWIGLREQRFWRIGLLAMLVTGAALLYFAVLAAAGVRLRSFMRR